MERRIKKLTLSVLMLALCSGIQAADQNANPLEDARALLPTAGHIVLVNVNVGTMLQRFIEQIEHLTGQNIALAGQAAQLTDRHAQLAQQLAAVQQIAQRNAQIELRLQDIVRVVQSGAQVISPAPIGLVNGLDTGAFAEVEIPAIAVSSTPQVIEPAVMTAASTHRKRVARPEEAQRLNKHARTPERQSPFKPIFARPLAPIYLQQAASERDGSSGCEENSLDALLAAAAQVSSDAANRASSDDEQGYHDEQCEQDSNNE